MHRLNALNAGRTDIRKAVATSQRKMGQIGHCSRGPPCQVGRPGQGGSAGLCLAPPGLGFGRWLPLWVFFSGPAMPTFDISREVIYDEERIYFGGWHDMVANFRSRSIAYEVECVRDLDHESMESISLGSHNFDKAQRNGKQHMCK
ncbi:hypothetical protein EJB05_52829, partial [Eragrostis curvula]